MKIVFVISNLVVAGAERVALQLSQNWEADGHSVFFLFTSIEPEKSYPLPAKYEYLSQYERLGLFEKIKRANKIIKRERPDIIVSFLDIPNFIAAYVGKKNKIPVVCSERNYPKVYPTNKIIRLLRSISFSLCDGVVFQTLMSQQYFKKAIQKKSRIIKNPCIGFSPLNRKPINKCVNVVSIGRLFEQKNYPMMIDAMTIVHKNFPSLSLQIYGDGPEKEKLISLIKEKDAEKYISMMGYCKTSDILPSARIFLMSSDFEGMPNSLLESLCSGVPSVCTDCPAGGAKEVVNGNGCILTKVGDAVEFAEAIMKIESNYDDYFNEAKSDAVYYQETLDVKEISREWLNFLNTYTNAK